MIAPLTKGMKLYHGSYCRVEKPDLRRCREFKDFGKGFYLTSDLSQATRFARLSLKKAQENGMVTSGQREAYISCFTCQFDATERIKIYENADAEWLHCIVGHRKENSFPKIVEQLCQFDIIGGKIANDATNATILAYMAGTFGEIGSPRADEICISLLLPDRLHDQYCFRSEFALENLSFGECLTV